MMQVERLNWPRFAVVMLILAIVFLCAVGCTTAILTGWSPINYQVATNPTPVPDGDTGHFEFIAWDLRNGARAMIAPNLFKAEWADGLGLQFPNDSLPRALRAAGLRTVDLVWDDSGLSVVLPEGLTRAEVYEIRDLLGAKSINSVTLVNGQETANNGYREGAIRIHLYNWDFTAEAPTNTQVQAAAAGNANIGSAASPPTVSDAGSNWAPVDAAVGADPTELVRDFTEGGCNAVIDPKIVKSVAEEVGVQLNVQLHGRPARCVVVVDEPLTVDQYHTVTNGLVGASEIAITHTDRDTIHPNPPCAEQLVQQDPFLLNVYFGSEGQLQIDETKREDFCQN